MRYITAWFSVVAEPFGLISARLRDCEDPAVRLSYREPHAILKTSEPKMSARWNVPPLPNDVGIESKDPVRPTLVPSNCALQNELVDLEEKPLVFGGRLRRLS